MAYKKKKKKTKMNNIVTVFCVFVFSSQVLGTPTREQIREMNPNYTEFKFPQIKAHPWTKVRRRNDAFTHQDLQICNSYMHMTYQNLLYPKPSMSEVKKRPIFKLR